MPDSAVRVDFLKKVHLFRGLTDMQVLSVADAMGEITAEEPRLVFEQGSKTETLYFVFRGRVSITKKDKKGQEKKISSLVRGDYFGEMSLLNKQPHSATATAEKGTILLTLSRERFQELLNNLPDLKFNFSVVMASRALTQQVKFDWLEPEEVIYFLARKHHFLMYRALIAPIFWWLVSTLFVWWSLFLPATGLGLAASLVAGAAFVLSAAWGVWRYIDWSNDYYVVTNQRAVWIEKTIGMYDSRKESLMSTILSVNTETDQWGRIFGFGTVVVRTFTGELRMNYVTYPKQAAAMIEEYWLRSRERNRAAEEEIMKKAILNKLNPPPPKPPAPPVVKKEKKLTLLDAARLYVRDMFKIRMEADGKVTYRKHWIVLLRDILAQSLLGLVILAAYPALWWMNGTPPDSWVGVLLFGAFVLVGGWWFYGYLDWSNDIYQVTADQIVDVYKEPFGKEERKSAPLEGILSLDFNRNGIIQLVFNYGTVNIQVGGANFDFVDVMDPPSVQQDIIRRKAVRDQKKREADTAAERDRMADWLVMYHRSIQEINKNSGNPGGNSG